MTPRLSLHGITKRYGSVVAVDGVSLSIAPGAVHGVLGENGAGKSTLMKLIYGAVRADAGAIAWEGRPVDVGSPRAVRALGISMVYQHFSLFESLTVAQNVRLGLPSSLSAEQVEARLVEIAGRYGLALDPGRTVHSLSIGERQRVEIARALLAEPRLLILDEPTSVLAPHAIEALFETLRKLSAAGCSILYISHKLDEVRALCQRCTILRGGRVTGELDPSRSDNASLARLMVGEEPRALVRQPARVVDDSCEQTAPALELRDLTLAPADPYGTALRDLRVTVAAGEIVGIAGVSGNGQRELLAALSGEDPRAQPGAILLFGRAIGATRPAARREQGLRVIPEERLGRAAVPDLTLSRNMLLTRRESIGRLGLLRERQLEDAAAQLIAQARVKASGVHATARSLSGGNLQKFVVARELAAEPKVLIVAQPTWGVDVGAAAQIRAELLALRRRGAAVLLISEDLEELFALCDRLCVIARGQLSQALPIASLSMQQVGLSMGGALPERAVSAIAPRVEAKR
jgi:general nucleoside transport system ATP-binding protein